MFLATSVYESFKALQGDQTEIHLEIGFRHENLWFTSRGFLYIKNT